MLVCVKKQFSVATQFGEVNKNVHTDLLKPETMPSYSTFCKIQVVLKLNPNEACVSSTQSVRVDANDVKATVALNRPNADGVTGHVGLCVMLMLTILPLSDDGLIDVGAPVVGAGVGTIWYANVEAESKTVEFGHVVDTGGMYPKLNLYKRPVSYGVAEIAHDVGKKLKLVYK